MLQAPKDKDVIFTVRLKPDRIEVDGKVGVNADEKEAIALCERLIWVVRDFSRANFSRADTMK